LGVFELVLAPAFNAHTDGAIEYNRANSIKKSTKCSQTIGCNVCAIAKTCNFPFLTPHDLEKPFVTRQNKNLLRRNKTLPAI